MTRHSRHMHEPSHACRAWHDPMILHPAGNPGRHFTSHLSAQAPFDPRLNCDYQNLHYGTPYFPGSTKRHAWMSFAISLSTRIPDMKGRPKRGIYHLPSPAVEAVGPYNRHSRVACYLAPPSSPLYGKNPRNSSF